MNAQRAGLPNRWTILAVLAAVAFMAQLDLFIVNVALPSMGTAFHGASLGDLSWVLNAYAIVFAALLVPMGRLADHHGRKRFLLAGVAVFTLASVICASSPTLAVLVAGRVLQAVGAAMIVPTSLGLLLHAFDPSEHGFVVGIWAGVGAVAASSGPPLGGLLVALDWRWIFLVNAPIGIAIVVAGLRVLPEVREKQGAQQPHPFSTFTVFAAIALFTLATVQGPEWGWTSARELALLGLALAMGVVSLWHSLRHPRALIEAALFESVPFRSATLALLLFFLGFAAWLLITVLFLQSMWGYSALRSGLAIAPGPVTAAIFAVSSSRVAERFGRRAPSIVGPLLLALASAFWIFAAHREPNYVTGFLPGLIIGGAGSGLTQAPLFAAAGTLSPQRATTGSGVLNMARQAGSALGVAMLVPLLGAAHGLNAFHRGWWFVLATTIGAAMVSTFGRSATAREAAGVVVLAE